MPQINKIKKHIDFTNTASKGVWANNNMYVLQCAHSFRLLEENESRIGFTASKKSIGNSVNRNFAKRRMRAAIIPLLKKLAIPGIDYVIIAKNPILECLFLDLVINLEKDLKKINKKVLL